MLKRRKLGKYRDSGGSQVDKGALNLFFLLLILLLLLATCVYLVISLHVDPVSESIKSDQVLKSFFVVHSRGESLASEFVVYYPVSMRGGLLEIAGNIGAIYDSIGRVDRIDAVYKEMGMDVYKGEVEKLIGTDIPFVVEIDLDQFCSMVDVMGGIKVFVPTAVDIVDEDGERWLLPSGAVLLDGDKTKDFLSYRLPDESEDNVQLRRQEAFLAFLQAMHGMKDVLFKKENFRKIQGYFKSELSEESLMLLLSQIANLDSEQIAPQSIMGTNRLVDGKRLLFPFYEGQLVKESVKRIVASLITSNEASHTRVYVLDIRNGTSVQGLARNTSVLLQSVGYDVLTTSNADRNDYDKTYIINHITDKEAAKSLADFIHCTQVVDDETIPDDTAMDSANNVDFTIVLGKDFDGRYVR